MGCLEYCPRWADLVCFPGMQSLSFKFLVFSVLIQMGKSKKRCDLRIREVVGQNIVLYTTDSVTKWVPYVPPNFHGEVDHNCI